MHIEIFRKMSLFDDIKNKTNSVLTEDFSIVETNEIQNLTNLQDGPNITITSATVFFINLKNLPMVTKIEGRRVAARIFKIYHQIAILFANETGGFVKAFNNSSILIIYPSSSKDIDNQVDNAFKLSYIFGKALPENHPQLSHISISIGIDHGRILGTKSEDEKLWFGYCIDKAAAISEMCIKPAIIGISGFVYSEISEKTKTTTHRVLGFQQKESVWIKSSYQFENELKSYYTTSRTTEIK